MAKQHKVGNKARRAKRTSHKVGNKVRRAKRVPRTLGGYRGKNESAGTYATKDGVKARCAEHYSERVKTCVFVSDETKRDVRRIRSEHGITVDALVETGIEILEGMTRPPRERHKRVVPGKGVATVSPRMAPSVYKRIDRLAARWGYETRVEVIGHALDLARAGRIS